ncbi:MAG TPA: hypothetical protein VGL77_09795 [Armatimonadota bacterium]|jgi:hypothetical protein
MKHWRKWLTLVVVALFMGSFFFANRVAAAVIQTVGNDTIRTHAMLVATITIGIGVVLSLTVAVLLAFLNKNRMVSSTGIFPVLFVLYGCFGMLFMRGGVLQIVLDLQPQRLSFLQDSIASLFISEVCYSFMLFIGILQLVAMRRARTVRV